MGLEDFPPWEGGGGGVRSATLREYVYKKQINPVRENHSYFPYIKSRLLSLNIICFQLLPFGSLLKLEYV
jgi:hypothetical protein